MVMYPNRMHVVSIEGSGVAKMADLKGKRVSTGSGGSATEVMAFRVIEAAGPDKDKDMKKGRVGQGRGVEQAQEHQNHPLFLGRRLPPAAGNPLAHTPRQAHPHNHQPTPV